MTPAFRVRPRSKACNPAGRWTTLAAGSSLAIPLAAASAAMITFLPTAFARTSGKSLVVVGAIFLLVRLAGIALDPLIGAAIDATRTRFGRFRPWAAAGALLLTASSVLLLGPHPVTEVAVFALCLFAMHLGYSAALTAQTAWLGRLAGDERTRTKVFTWWQSATMLGLLLVLLLSALAAAHGDRLAALRNMLVIATPLAAVLAMWAGRGQPSAPEIGHRQRVKLKLGVLADSVIARALLIEFVTATGSGVLGVLFFLFFEDVRGYSAVQATLLLTLYYATGVAGAQIWRRLANGLGVRRALLVAALYDVVCQPTALILSGRSFALAAVVVAVAGLSFGSPLLVRTLTAERAEQLRRRSDGEHIALVQSAVGASGKLGQALAQLALVALGAAGFVAPLGGRNSPAALEAVLAICIVAPFVLSAVSALTSASLVLGRRPGRARLSPQPTDASGSPVPTTSD